MFESLLVVFTVFYTVQLLLFIVALLTSQYTSALSYRPTVSIVVAARNEEKAIGSCINALLKIDYPKDLMEIIVVDDNSGDATGMIVAKFLVKSSNLKLVNAEEGSGSLKGKANALSQGVDVSTGEVLMFTDADCLVPSTWVSDTVKYFSDETVGIVAGFTLLHSPTPFAATQSLDWLFLVSVASAAAKLGFPVTAVGTNLSMRKLAYDQVGGYKNIPFSVTEDYSIFSAIMKQTEYRAVIPKDPGMLVQSEPCKTWQSLLNQKLRWFRGGKDMSLSRLLLYGASYAFHSLVLLGLVLGVTEALIALALKFVVDFCFILVSLRTFRRWSLMFFFPLFEVYYSFYILVFPILVGFGSRVRWKERVFR